MATRTRGTVARTSAFWDASALVSLCANQAITPGALALYKTYTTTVWWATPVEIASALARLSRMRLLSSKELSVSKKLADDLADAWWVIQPSEAIRLRAISLLTSYDLRAADSLQLSSATEWCEDRPSGKVFLTADQKLRDAARSCGFDTSQL